MKKRVTVSLRPEILRLAKKAERKKKITLSRLIESLLRSETTPGKRGIVASMIGIASLRSPAPGIDPLYDA